MKGPRDPSRPEPRSDNELLAAITRDLRAIYADVIRMPLPDDLAAALRRLESRAETTQPVVKPALGAGVVRRNAGFLRVVQAAEEADHLKSGR